MIAIAIATLAGLPGGEQNHAAQAWMKVRRAARAASG
jgi:hypothetical protein